MNAYSMVHNNPATYSDKAGLMSQTIELQQVPAPSGYRRMASQVYRTSPALRQSVGDRLRSAGRLLTRPLVSVINGIAGIGRAIRGIAGRIRSALQRFRGAGNVADDLEMQSLLPEEDRSEDKISVTETALTSESTSIDWDDSADFNKHLGSGLEFDWIDLEETLGIPDRQGAMQVADSWDDAGWDDIGRMSIVNDSGGSDTDSYISDADSFVSDTSSQIYETFNIAEAGEDENSPLLFGSNNRVTPAAISSLALTMAIFGLLWWYQSRNAYNR